ncbi:HK97 gp10 family phage protein [Methyloversatilis universalis]|uniref:HK97 gp10 family phage protein n=1 Tax=Methyloversatilis universalis TaxID=378211 RepID=UPI00035E98B8|nr:HK97 gp10 family phage protein [Methyloversatilis universalis]
MGQFSVDISRFVEKTNGNIERAARQAVVLAAQGLIMRTPVDTGRARANWVFGAGAINYEVVETRTDRSGGATQGAIAAAVMTVRIASVPYLYVSNSLPYVQRLEDGWSQQAPAGMVKATLAELPRQIEAFARSIA